MPRLILRSIVAILLAAGGIAGSGAQAAPLPVVYRANAPYFGNDVRFAESAVFWFGHVTPAENYADVRLGIPTVRCGFMSISSIGVCGMTLTHRLPH